MIQNHFISRPRVELKFYRLPGATFYDRINTIYQFIKPFFDNKMSIVEEYGAFKRQVVRYHYENAPIQIY